MNIVDGKVTYHQTRYNISLISYTPLKLLMVLIKSWINIKESIVLLRLIAIYNTMLLFYTTTTHPLGPRKDQTQVYVENNKKLHAYAVEN